ncbi:3-hydroxybutyrate dehydrogenase [Kribbella sp. VKM Ac-2568]|uniref:3-hydroxybutyrate dehydrogenase n=1 Tax=Kribbella sp. VKM Ac-2568 TaxID=2512219 RepID=UPI00104AD4DD|nr:3-hydroxybutyrate dehydrogenase [Kribbella sp. VKM Ac-2568]TCM39633.1 3-hydroxybutyrate dehydrogenase [Kribbella sp. VKM Ac-2568]
MGDVGLGALVGRSVVVTGGASGIGAACAEKFAGAGADVVVIDLDGPRAKEVADQIGGRAEILDLSDLGAVDALELRCDILINNAGLQHISAIEDFSPEQFSLMLRVMLEAPFRLVRQVLPGMYANGWGRVVNISSVHGLRASPFKAAYVAAKHGLEGLSKVIALEGAAQGVTSNCINPAYVRTPLVERQVEAQAVAHGIEPDEVLEQIMLAPVAIKQLIEPEQVAELAAYLCSPHADSMTGTSFVMDGGWTAR